MSECRKCGGTLAKKGFITSGNIKYQMWKCNRCNSEEAKVFEEERSIKQLIDRTY